MNDNDLFPTAYMFPEDIDNFSKKETNATAYSIPMINEGGETIELYHEEVVRQLKSKLEEVESKNSALETKNVSLESMICSLQGSIKTNKPVGKIAPNADEAFKIQETYKGIPSGWLQWKGTDVCMDIYCKCGYHSHYDGDFTYHIECPKCKTIYYCNGHIEFIELLERPVNCVQTPDYDEMDMDE